MLIYLLIARLADQSLHSMHLINNLRLLKPDVAQENWQAGLIAGRDHSRFFHELQRMPGYLIDRQFATVDRAKLREIH